MSDAVNPTTEVVTTQSRIEAILDVILGRLADMPQPNSRIEQLLIDLKAAIDAGGTADLQLAEAIDANAKEIALLQGTAQILAIAVAGKIDSTDIVVCTREAYDELEEKTAIEYHIIEE